jgi:asparaginyl-tRNA synthetase
MRKHQHLRFRTNYFSAIMKIRSKALSALREFFDERTFYHIDPNVITTSDCEGAGEVFQIVAPSDKINGGKTDFFNKNAYLTVSSQLQLEAACAGLGNCYTMNPSFRAEKSNTSRHLASFTHIEYEASFGGLQELLDFSEDMVKYVIRKCLEECSDEYKFLNSFYSKGIISRLQRFSIDDKYPRISYDEAIAILNEAKRDKKLKVEPKDMPEWGDDLGSVCEKYLAEVKFNSPIMVYNYPKKLKSFYMKEDEHNSDVVNCMDMLVPNIGELIGSSVREDDYDKLISNMDIKGVPKEPLDWYIDLRRNGSWRHYGGGLGFERLVGLLTMDSSNFNVRDCCAFPVCYSECEY